MRLIRYDMYGRGLTSSPKAIYEREFYLTQLEELIEHLNINKVDTLIGVSFGASMSTLFALKYPKKVNKILFISPAVNWLGNHGYVKIFKTPLVGRPLYNWYAIPKVIERAKALVSPFPVKPNEFDYGLLVSEQFNENNKVFWETLYSQITNDAITSYYDQYSSLAQLNEHSVHLIWGDKDEEIPASDMKRLQKTFSNLDYKEVSGGGHGLIAEKFDFIFPFIKKVIHLEK